MCVGRFPLLIEILRFSLCISGIISCSGSFGSRSFRVWLRFRLWFWFRLRLFLKLVFLLIDIQFQNVFASFPIFSFISIQSHAFRQSQVIALAIQDILGAITAPILLVSLIPISIDLPIVILSTSSSSRRLSQFTWVKKRMVWVSPSVSIR